jgi:preprotein translocase subunit SecA
MLNSQDLAAKQFREVFNIQTDPAEIAPLLELKQSKVLNEWFNPFYKAPDTLGALALKEKLKGYLERIFLKIKTKPEIYSASQNLILEIIDNAWSGHLELMDILKEEAGLFSYASEDPLVDFVLESQNLFMEMEKSIKKQFFTSIFLCLKQQGLMEP